MSAQDDSSTVGDNKSEKSDKSADEEDQSGKFLEGETDPSFLSRLNVFLKKQTKTLAKTFIDYGPPYVKAFDPALINECAKPEINHLELHRLLNARIDPNLPDPDDLYYTPTHWCARNSHFLGLKMLIKARADVNVTNEMGVTPLDLAVMMKFPPNRRASQLRCVRLLLEDCGADVNTRDKGGFSPIDHAAINQDLELILMLLRNGANVMRENHIFVGKRHHILRQVHDPECYKVLYEKLVQEENEAFARQIKQQNRNFVLEEENRVRIRFEKIKKKKREKPPTGSKRKTNALQTDLEKLPDPMHVNNNNNIEQSERQHGLNGTWAKDFSGHWEFHRGRLPVLTSGTIYEENKKLMSQLQEQNSVKRYNSMWSKLVDKGKIEIPWTREQPFRLDNNNRAIEDDPTALLHNQPQSFGKEKDEDKYAQGIDWDEELAEEDLG